MILILHDTPEGYPFVAERLTLPCRRVYSPQKRRKYLTWIAGAWKVLRESKKDDVIVTLYDFQGVLCYWIGRMAMRRRKILAINLLLKNKPTMRNRLAAFLYRKALHDKRFIATTSTEAYGYELSQRLNLKKRLPVLPDVFYDSYLSAADRHKISDNGYVFSGGRNGRDWPLLVEIARQLPETAFHIALPTACRDRLESSTATIPPNITFHCDISTDEFDSLIAGSSIVALPLDTKAPAGLIVVFQAGACRKPVIISDTPSTHTYIKDDRGIGLSEKTEDWCEAIRLLKSNPDKAQRIADNLHTYLTDECNEAKYVDRIERLIHNFNQFSQGRQL